MLQKEVIAEGYYKAATIKRSFPDNSYGVDPYLPDERKISFTIPDGEIGRLSFSWLINADSMYSALANWGQFRVLIDGVMWNNGGISTQTGEYSHPDLLEAGEHTISFQVHDYGRKLSSKIWLDKIRVDILEAEFEDADDIEAEKESRELRSDGYTYIKGSFNSLPEVSSYGEVSNVDIAGPIGTDKYTQWVSEAVNKKAFDFIIPHGKIAIFTNIPVVSQASGSDQVKYTLERFNRNQDLSTLSWIHRGQLQNPENIINQIPGEYIMNPGLLSWVTYPSYSEAHLNNSSDGYKRVAMSSPRYTSADFLGFTSVLADKDKVHWVDMNYFLTGQGENKRYFLEKNRNKGVKFSFNLPEGNYFLKNFRLYTIENGVKVYAENDSFADSAKLGQWTQKDIGAATVKELASADQGQEAGIIYKKGQLVSYGINYYDYEGDPSKRQYWKYTHTPFNDGAHPQAAVILDDKNETVNISGKVLNNSIDRFYIDGKYTVEHWQEDNTARPPEPSGNPDYDKLSNVETITFYIQGGGSAPWIKSIKTDPDIVTEGSSFKVRSEIDDEEKDTLQLTTEVYRDMKLIYTHKKTNIKANPSGVYPVVTTDKVPGIAQAGRYEIVCTVRDDTGAGLDSYRFTVVSEGKITGRVSHTDQWDKNRKKYNMALFNEEYNMKSSFPEYSASKAPRKRGTNVFWSGEKFMLSADVAGKPDRVSAEISGNANYKIILTDTGRKNADGEKIYAGELWDKTMVNRWGKNKPQELMFIFSADYGGGLIKTFEEKVIIDSNTDYWLLHRLY